MLLSNQEFAKWASGLVADEAAAIQKVDDVSEVLSWVNKNRGTPQKDKESIQKYMDEFQELAPLDKAKKTLELALNEADEISIKIETMQGLSTGTRGALAPSSPELIDDRRSKLMCRASGHRTCPADHNVSGEIEPSRRFQAALLHLSRKKVKMATPKAKGKGKAKAKAT